MEKPVAHRCLVDVAGFGVVDAEVVVRAMCVRFGLELFVEKSGLIYQTVLELQNVLLAALACAEFLPRFKYVLERYDIVVRMSEPLRASPPQRLLPVLERVKQAYLLWHEYHATLPKLHRYTLGERIDVLFVEIMEAVSGAAFLPRGEKAPYVRLAIRKLDTLKLLLLVLWESKSVDTKKYAALSLKVDEAGRMLGGWQGQLLKNSTPPKRGKK